MNGLELWIFRRGSSGGDGATRASLTAPRVLCPTSVRKRSSELPMSFRPNSVSLLVIVPCGRSKIWSKNPDAGPTPAADAYTGAPFTVNRQYAEASGGDWVILSAKYGFLRPTDVIPGPYEVTFKVSSTRPIAVEALRAQVQQMGLDRYARVIGLGGMEYLSTIERAFSGTRVTLGFPFSGLPIGKAMRATKQGIGDVTVPVTRSARPSVPVRRK